MAKAKYIKKVFLELDGEEAAKLMALTATAEFSRAWPGKGVLGIHDALESAGVKPYPCYGWYIAAGPGKVAGE